MTDESGGVRRGWGGRQVVAHEVISRGDTLFAREIGMGDWLWNGVASQPETPVSRSEELTGLIVAHLRINPNGGFAADGMRDAGIEQHWTAHMDVGKRTKLGSREIRWLASKDRHEMSACFERSIQFVHGAGRGLAGTSPGTTGGFQNLELVQVGIPSFGVGVRIGV